MLINFNIEKLNKLLHDFYILTGITISVWNADFQQLSFQPREMCAFCRIIKSTPKGKRSCFLSDKKLCIQCSKIEKPIKHVCHAGLIDFAFPIKYKDKILGYIMFGQISDKSTKEMADTIQKLKNELGVNAEELTKAYESLIKYDEVLIDSAANILNLATRYLWLAEYVNIYDTLASEIDNYIRSHISENITVDSLCNAFNISKKHLYAVSHRNYGTAIGEHIGALRINEAKRLLESTDFSIQQIAYMVGVTDYNYFAKFFKQHVGISPSKYRKGFPFNIHGKTLSK